MTTLTRNQQRRRKELLQICDEKQGEYLPAHHGPGSWATTYSNEFIEAVRELGSLYQQAGCDWPQLTISRDLRERGIKTCRGATMTLDRLQYLWETHIAQGERS